MGKVETYGITAKLDRAREHFEHLDREMSAFTDRSPFVPVPLPNPKPHVLAYGIRVILGEAIHDLRSALDNAIYELSVERFGKRPDDNTGFPIYETANEFRSRGGERQIGQTGEAVQGYVRSLQTYNEGCPPEGFDLLSLNRFWNRDKHRLVAPWGVQVESADHCFTSTPPYKGIRFSTRVLHDEHAEAMRMWFANPVGDEVNVNGYCGLSLAFDDPADPEGESRRLWSLYESAAEVCLTLISMVGRQDEPPF